MRRLDLSRVAPRNADVLNADSDSAEVLIHSTSGGVSLPGGYDAESKYLIGYIEILEDHSLPMMLRFYGENDESERVYIRFVLLPGVKTLACFELSCVDMKNGTLDRDAGMLKKVVYGTRCERGDITRVELGCKEVFHDVRVRFEGFYVSDEKPREFPLPDIRLVDEMGQWSMKDWQGKAESVDSMARAIRENMKPAAFPVREWNRWGGDSRRRIKEGTGFFSRAKTEDGRWHLCDPDGCDYFSMGVCCVRPEQYGDITYTEKQIALNMRAPEYKEFFREAKHPWFDKTMRGFDFCGANLKRVFGSEYKEKWVEMTYGILMGCGVNSQGNGSNLDYGSDKCRLPYVRQLRDFPKTKTYIFRDFPDVLSPEYAENSSAYAKQLEAWKDDANLIGYFLQNEPNFGFIRDAVVANEVLNNPEDTYCRRGLIDWLRGKYENVEALNCAWGAGFEAFSDLSNRYSDMTAIYPRSLDDLREFSRFLVSEFCRVPSDACKKVDPNHMNLGMRWAKMQNPDLLAGWENFDVFSFNCYNFDVAADMDFITGAGIDLPLLVGEYHCGALDRGLPSTGLKGVENQFERGVMWRGFVETCAAHPFGVGAHWFQYQDEFCLGRFDGENYQIGLIDICMKPYSEMTDAIRETAYVLYDVRNGFSAPYARKPKTIPMVG